MRQIKQPKSYQDDCHETLENSWCDLTAIAGETVEKPYQIVTHEAHGFSDAVSDQIDPKRLATAFGHRVG